MQIFYFGICDLKKKTKTKKKTTKKQKEICDLILQ